MEKFISFVCLCLEVEFCGYAIVSEDSQWWCGDERFWHSFFHILRLLPIGLEPRLEHSFICWNWLKWMFVF